MIYRLKIYGITGTGTPVTTFTTPDFSVRGWAKAINGARNMSFSVQKNNSKATPDNLQKERQVTLLRKGSGGFVPVWHGFIRADREVGNEKIVECVGQLEILEKRETAVDETFNGQGSQEVFDLLAATNVIGDTGIVTGDGGVTTTRDIKISGHESVLSAIDKIALAHGAEYEIDESRRLNFVPSLGSDKSATVQLTFRRDGQPGTNLDVMEIGEDAKDLSTRVVGYTSGGLEYTYNNASSQAKYGILIERKQFNEAQDLPTLTAMTTAYGLQRSTPLSDFRAVPTLASKKYLAASGERRLVGLEYEDVRPGDLVTVTIVTGNTSTSEVKRIAELSVSVSKNGRETLAFTFSDQQVFVTASSIESAASRDTERRIAQLEQNSGGGGGAAAWGSITGTLSAQTDLNSALSGKVPTGRTVNGHALSADVTVTKTDVGLGNCDNTSDANKPISTATATALGGKADLVGGSVPAAQLPSYVDDVVEVANYAALPGTGESGKIYVTLDTNVTYRWSGTAYVEISASLALGETSGTAYRGDRGKTAYDHSQATGNPHGVTKADVGLGNVANAAQVTSVTGTAPISSSGGTTPAISLNDAGVTYAKIQNISATSRILGRITAGAGAIEELTAANVKTILSLSATDVGLGNVTNNAQVKKAANSTNGSIPKWSGTDGDAIVDGYTVVTSVGSPGSDTALPTEKAVRTALGGASVPSFLFYQVFS